MELTNKEIAQVNQGCGGEVTEYFSTDRTYKGQPVKLVYGVDCNFTVVVTFVLDADERTMDVS